MSDNSYYKCIDTHKTPMPLTNLKADSLLKQTVQAVQQTGEILLKRFDSNARPTDLPSLLAMIAANDKAVATQLRQQLQAIRSQAQWLEDEEAQGPLPPGEWWLVDAVEGNVNHIHGMGDWGVTATLVRDNQAVLTVVDEPLAARVYTAQVGYGAFLNGQPLRVSAKQDLRAAIVSTGQARPGEDIGTRNRMGASITAMLHQALLVGASVPTTMQLAHVAAGRLDAFWQQGNVVAGLAGGALLVAEAGGTVSDWHGAPWTLASASFVAAAPGVHTAIVNVLGKVG
jgi:myo-inositol-1(or 4)-monophosphatase